MTSEKTRLCVEQRCQRRWRRLGKFFSNTVKGHDAAEKYVKRLASTVDVEGAVTNRTYRVIKVTEKQLYTVTTVIK